MKLIIANWKSNKSLGQVTDWMETFGKEVLGSMGEIKVIVCPPFPFIVSAKDLMESNPHKKYMSLGVQDISSFPAGSYTGAVSAQNLKELNVTHVIVGHSERRRYFHENHQDVANKVDQALENGMTPIVCVDDEYIWDQASAIASDKREKCVVAYEALSAIGTGNNIAVEEVQLQFKEIKKAFGDVPVLYGGSVDAGNVAEYMEISNGVLVGSASLKPDSFVDLIRAAC